MLGIVINKLAEGTERNGGHIPYRDSKLTRILQPALGEAVQSLTLAPHLKAPPGFEGLIAKMITLLST